MSRPRRSLSDKFFGESRRGFRGALAPAYWVIAVVLVLSLGRSFLIRRNLYIDPDEFEHLHVAWSMSKGLVIYRDFFEHHPPGFYLALMRLFPFFHPETSVEAALGFISFGRLLMWLLTILSLGLTYRLGKLWRGTSVGILGVFFLVNAVFFREKSIEFRPDMPMLVFWLASLVMLLKAIGIEPGEWKARRYFIGSGLAWGLAVFFSQKLLMVSPGLLLAAIGYLFSGKNKSGVRDRGLNILMGLGSALMPFLLASFYFISKGAFSAFIYSTFIVNLIWVDLPTQCRNPLVLMSLDPGLFGLSLFGIVKSLLRVSVFKPSDSGEFLILACCVSLVAGLFFMPDPQKQYYLEFLPLLSLFAARTILSGLDWFTTRFPAFSRHSGLILASWLVLILCPYKFYFISGLKPGNYEQTDGNVQVDNAGQISILSRLMNRSAPTDTVLDGWSGFGVFRPHAYFRFFYHDQILWMMSQEERHRILSDFASGKTVPDIIVYDDFLEGLFSEVIATVKLNYRQDPDFPRLLYRKQGVFSRAKPRRGLR